MRFFRSKHSIFAIPAMLVLAVTFFAFTNFGGGDGEESKSYALIIGIDQYTGTDWQPLKTPVNDCRVLDDILTTKYGFDNVVTLYNEDATREKIIDNLDKMAQALNENDDLLVYYSGHGIEIGNEGYWVPANAQSQERYDLIPNSEIKNALTKTKSKHVLLMVDACFSGTIFKSGNLFLKNDGQADYFDRVEDLVSRQAITAGGLEPVPDGDVSTKHSIFAKYLIKTLEENEKDHLDAFALYSKIRMPVGANSPNTPQFGHIQNTGHEGGQFVFKRTAEKTCDFEGVTIEEGEAITFEYGGGMLHAKTNEKNISYEWYKNSEPLNISTPDLKVDDRGLYMVILRDENGDCEDADVIDVEISLPQVGVVIDEGNRVEFTLQGRLNANASSDVYDYKYEWRKNNFIVGTEPSIVVTESGVYTVILKLKDGRELSTSQTNVIIKDRTYVVRIGDDVARIAKKFYNDVNKSVLIYRANQGTIKEGEILRVGTTLVIPAESKDFNPTRQIKIAAFDSFAPFSKVGMFNDGLLTNIVDRTFTEMNQDIYVDFMSGNKAKAMTFSGRTTATFPITKTVQDEALFYFSDPLYRVLNVFFTKKGSNISYTKTKDIKGKVVAITRGFQCNKLIEYSQKGIIGVTAYDSYEECFRALKEGKVDMVAAPQIVGLMVLSETQNLDSKDFNMLDKTIETSTLHMVISKENPNGALLMEEFNAAFRALVKEGVISQITDTHIDKFQSSLK